GHALLCCKDKLYDNFAVINADDFYGKNAFEALANHLSSCKSTEYCMVGYRLENTVTDNGYVSRGVCVSDENSRLKSITEIKKIEKHGDIIEYLDGNEWKKISKDTTVSMTAFGFTPDFLKTLEKGFCDFLNENKNDLSSCEFYLPFAVQTAMDEKKCTVTIKNTDSKWFGVTYKQDKPSVCAGINALVKTGVYPEKI
ncbi:MAG: nucleotidyltransferase, partial [Clostridia bacterium]